MPARFFCFRGHYAAAFLFAVFRIAWTLELTAIFQWCDSVFAAELLDKIITVAETALYCDLLYGIVSVEEKMLGFFQAEIQQISLRRHSCCPVKKRIEQWNGDACFSGYLGIGKTFFRMLLHLGNDLQDFWVLMICIKGFTSGKYLLKYCKLEIASSLKPFFASKIESSLLAWKFEGSFCKITWSFSISFSIRKLYQS